MSKQIQQAVAISKEKIQRQIDRNRHSIVLNQIIQLKDLSMKKCMLCDYTGIRDDIIKHMKNNHKEDFLTMGDNINKYNKCKVCKKLFKNKNIEEHQLKCGIKEDNKKAAREMNKVRNLKRTNQYYQEISEEKQEEEHYNLLKEFGVGIEINSKHIIQSQESNCSESELKTSILNSKLFQTKKKLKKNEEKEDNELKQPKQNQNESLTNEEKQDNELTVQTQKNIPLKQPTQDQSDSLANVLEQFNFSDEDKGDTTKKKTRKRKQPYQ